MAVIYHQGRFPPDALDWPQLLPLIGQASASGARPRAVTRDQAIQRQATRRAGLPRVVEHLRRAAGVLRITCAPLTLLQFEMRAKLTHNLFSGA